ncbi:MAG: helix-turn-helix transcriptional regulator [Candidatus Jordarchaeum sp.]|uniref:helix-turn-helix transcriptional regulator n=1 Tax=Candidatus Jordarchaeum sp. TaxID=2823881 RepID=UPI00404B547F
MKLLFELASIERLLLLKCIDKEPKRLSDISRELEITTPEVYRQLNRLTAQSIVSKTSDGLYEITPFGRVIIQSLDLFKFLTQHRDYLLNHNLTVIPNEFIHRLGELNQCELISGVYRIITIQEKYMSETQSRLWTISKQIFHLVFPVLEKLSGKSVDKSVDIRLILPKSIVDTQQFKKLKQSGGQFVRLLDEVNIVLGVLDEAGGICFPTLEGNIDMSFMIGCRNQTSVKWLIDLHKYYWERAEPL